MRARNSAVSGTFAGELKKIRIMPNVITCLLSYHLERGRGDVHHPAGLDPGQSLEQVPGALEPRAQGHGVELPGGGATPGSPVTTTRRVLARIGASSLLVSTAITGVLYRRPGHRVYRHVRPCNLVPFLNDSDTRLFPAARGHRPVRRRAGPAGRVFLRRQRLGAQPADQYR